MWQPLTNVAAEMSWDVPPEYRLVGGSAVAAVVVIAAGYACEFAGDIIIWAFRRRRFAGPPGRELAARMLEAAGAADVRVEESFYHSTYRKVQGETDYRPASGVLELTADKAGAATTASVGLVAVEVGRVLQYRSGFPIRSFDRLARFANVAGVTWVLPFFAAAALAAVIGTYWAFLAADLFWALGGLTVGFLFLYASTRAALEADAARRGLAAIRASGALAAGEAAAVRTFLIIFLSFLLGSLLLTAFNVFARTARR